MDSELGTTGCRIGGILAVAGVVPFWRCLKFGFRFVLGLLKRAAD